LPVIAAQSPADCFDVALEAWRIATRYMTPVILLSDGYIANGAEPWKIPKIDELPSIPVEHPGANGSEDHTFLPYQRNERLARPWAIPGTPGLMHRIGGLEKQDITGNVCYDPANHEHMVQLRAAKIAGIARDIPQQQVVGAESGKLLVLSWGGTYGACATAVRNVFSEGGSVGHAHLRYLTN
jgi:2-oxoglutarate ferredoxin oxidoreductase subunit alpha